MCCACAYGHESRLRQGARRRQHGSQAALQAALQAHLVGSSRNMTAGAATSSTAMLSRLRCSTVSPCTQARRSGRLSLVPGATRQLRRAYSPSARAGPAPSHSQRAPARRRPPLRCCAAAAPAPSSLGSHPPASLLWTAAHGVDWQVWGTAGAGAGHWHGHSAPTKCPPMQRGQLHLRDVFCQA